MMIHSISTVYSKMPLYAKLLVMLSITLLITSLFKQSNEGMQTSGSGSGSGSSVFLEGDSVYDNFYASVYDYLVFSKMKNNYEINEITSATNITDDSIILDIGSGLGHHVNELQMKNINAIGIDKSAAMVKEASTNYPNATFRQGDATNMDILQAESISHILCLYFTAYYFPDKTILFTNCFYWLHPGGYMVVHLVNKHLFDPILPAGNPLNVLSIQKYAPQRVTNTKITFDDFVYTSNFTFENESETLASFNEKFKFNDGSVRKTRHLLYMEDMADIITIAKQVGFNLITKIDMMRCAYENQYLFVLQKPY